jgi:hypothetical protein
MDAMLANVATGSPLERLQTARPQQAKAGLKKLHIREGWPLLGLAMAHAISLARLTRKEAAARVDKSESQMASECAGAIRPQIECFLADDVLRGPMLIALAHQSGAFDVVTTITVRTA